MNTYIAKKKYMGALKGYMHHNHVSQDKLQFKDVQSIFPTWTILWALPILKLGGVKSHCEPTSLFSENDAEHGERGGERVQPGRQDREEEGRARAQPEEATHTQKGTVLIGYCDYLGTRQKNNHRPIIVTGP